MPNVKICVIVMANIYLKTVPKCHWAMSDITAVLRTFVIFSHINRSE